ncbi:MAG TPA: MBL fold metallo-hydrolase [Clostridiales bacterium]|nr:MBL fold metallo-hydrolase [Clostridiales bacterium]
MKVYVLKSGMLAENTFLITEQGKALVVDPGVAGEKVFTACESLCVKPIAVLLTHGHADHIYGAAFLQRAGLKVYAHQKEFEVIAGRANLALALGCKVEPFTPDVAFKGEESTLSLPPFTIRVIFTPGHTQGGVCYLIKDCLFSGDTLFAGSYGRTDFPTGDEQDLLCSIANDLFELPKSTLVYAGHSDSFSGPEGIPMLASPDTTIENEYYTNPILNLL